MTAGPPEPDWPGCHLCRWTGPPEWTLSYVGLDARREGTREALLTLANGYLATRGAVPEARADGDRYPGSYVAGVYNRLVSTDPAGTREDESIVNLPNWLPVLVRPAGGQWLDPAVTRTDHHHLLLDLRDGVLHREVVYAEGGRRTRLRQQRLVSMASPHLAAISTTVIAEDWSGPVRVRSLLDARVDNDNVPSYRALAHRHLTGVQTGPTGPGRAASTTRPPGPEGLVWLVCETNQSRRRVALAARLRTSAVDAAVIRLSGAGFAGHDVAVDLVAGVPVTLEKVVAVFTSRDRAISEPLAAARQEAAGAPDFGPLRAAHAVSWEQLWQRCGIGLHAAAHPAQAVNLNVFHTLQSLSPHTADHDAGVPARGLHGEGYRGHVFWDELFVFPFYNLRLPMLSRALLRYRYRRLDQARRLAAGRGRPGALFPWQSGSDGREETPASFFNPRSGRWMPDHSRLQYHVGLAVAYNVWQYWEVTRDLDFMVGYGAEMLVEIARFWAGMARHDPGADRYDIRGVMGPDEFHDGYPGHPGGGIDNNTYVNVMTAWALARAHEAYHLLGEHHGGDVWQRLGLSEAEVRAWDRIASRLRIPWLPNGLPAQFEGYGELAELPLAEYRQRYGDIGRLDLILEAEGRVVRDYQVSKQADVLMLLYLFDAEVLTGILDKLGYRFDPATIPAMVEWYLKRTTHGSSLSRVAHSWVLARTDRPGSWRMLHDALDVDLDDASGTTREGIHLGAMAGAVDILQRCYTGLDARAGALWLNPVLPRELDLLRLRVQYRNQWLSIVVDRDRVTVSALPCAVPPVTVHVYGRPHHLRPGGTLAVPYRRHPGRPAPAAPAPAG